MGKWLAVLNTVLAIGYPVAVYVGLTRFSARGVGLLLLVLLLPTVWTRLRAASAEDRLTVLRIPLLIGALAALSAWLDDRRFVLALPVLINLVLLVTFGATLYRGTPMVERFARMQEPHLSAAQVRYCRTVTGVWCGFFLLNGGVTAALALLAPLAWWALHTGLIAYVAIGTLAGAEYLTRKARFREYGPGLHDRVLARIFPPRTDGAPP